MNRNRILLVAPVWLGSLGGFCRDGLESLGQTVQTFSMKPEHYSGDLGYLGRTTRRGRRLIRYLVANLNLLKVASAFRPSVVFVLKGRWIHPVTLETIRKRQQAMLLNWNPDSPFNSVNSSPWLIKAIPHYDCHFTWGRFMVEKLIQAGACRVEYLPFAYDPRFHFPVTPDIDCIDKLATDVCFIGTWEQQRERFMKALVDFDLGIWGNSWERTVDERVRACWRGPALYGVDMCKIYGVSKIILNFIRAQNGSAHNMRTFEIPATGGFMLTTRTEEHQALLGEGRGVACFSDEEELRYQVARYLEDEKQRKVIAYQGFEVITRGGHTYQDRMHRVLEITALL
jgi:spore maturation protein CgeB